MKSLAVVLAAIVFVAFSFSAVAQDKEAPAPKAKAMKEAAALDDVTVTGKLSKNEMGKYVITEADGTHAVLPEVGKDVADLDKLVGKDVTLTGKGHVATKTAPGGEKSKRVSVKSVAKIEEAAAKADAPKTDVKKEEAPKAEAK